jgi:hypothetical protein
MPPDKRDETNAFHLISDILDKLIETQQATADSNAALKESVSTMVETLKKMEGHFTNGFKSDIKSHIDISNRDLLKPIEKNGEYLVSVISHLREVSTKAQEAVDTLSKPWFWIKIVGATTAALGSIAAILALLLHKYGG